jgi:hypothetical protein
MEREGMIAIINTDERNAEGAYRYRLQINDRLIAEFYHYQSDGLGECLRAAAIASDIAHDLFLSNLLDRCKRME